MFCLVLDCEFPIVKQIEDKERAIAIITESSVTLKMSSKSLEKEVAHGFGIFFFNDKT